MWSKIARFVIYYRIYLLIGTALITAVMAYMARNLELTYDFVKVVPQNDEELIYYNNFKKQFGEDGNILAVGMADEKIKSFPFPLFNTFKRILTRRSLFLHHFSNKILFRSTNSILCWRFFMACTCTKTKSITNSRKPH
jgi:hypothetical protein